MPTVHLTILMLWIIFILLGWYALFFSVKNITERVYYLAKSIFRIVLGAGHKLTFIKNLPSFD